MTPTIDTGSQRRQRTYGNWRPARGVGLLGLGPLATAAMFGILLLASLLLLVNFVVAMAAIFVGILVLAPLAIRINGRTGLQIVAARWAWMVGRSRRQHIYRSGVASPVTRTHQLPGVLARAELHQVETGRGGTVGIVVLPQPRHYTVTLKCSPEGTDLVDPEVVDTRVGHLASWLASLSREPNLVQAAVTIETTPDPGTRLAAEVASMTRADAPALARQVLAEVVRTYPAGAAAVDTRVSLTFAAPQGRKISHNDMCRDVAARLAHLHQGLTAAGAGAVTPLGPRSLMRVVRSAYDPAASAERDDSDLATAWLHAGPVASLESWTDYRHDGAVSRTWGMVEAPRGLVFANALTRLTEPDPLLLRKRVTLIWMPYLPAEATKLVEADKRDARFAANQKSRPTARNEQDIAATEQAAAEEATGASVVRFTVVVTATVREESELVDAAAVVQSQAGQARLVLRPMYGCQAATFAAGLPVGLVLSRHATIPY